MTEESKELTIAEDADLKYGLSNRGKKVEALMKSIGMMRQASSQGQIEFGKVYKTREGGVDTKLTVILETGKLGESHGDLVGFVVTEQVFISPDLNNIELVENSISGPDIQHVYNMLGEGSREDELADHPRKCEAEDCNVVTNNLYEDPVTGEMICITCFSKRLSEGTIPIDR